MAANPTCKVIKVGNKGVRCQCNGKFVKMNRCKK
ncbi:hypothetical protein ES705_14586 [subsurface metagenome]